MKSLRDGMGSGWDGKFFRRCHRGRRPLVGGKWKSQNRVGVLENRVKSMEKTTKSERKEKT